MLKPVLENKRFGTSPQLAIDFGGKLVTRNDLLQAKRKATENLASEKDPEKVNEAAMLLARINTALDVFAQIDKAKAAAEPLRQKLHNDEAKAADQERLIFEGYCEEIAHPAILRLTHLEFTKASTVEERAEFLRIRQEYGNLLKKLLKFEETEKQAIEIRIAQTEKRNWKVTVRLPEPQNVPLRYDQGRARPKPALNRMYGTGPRV